MWMCRACLCFSLLLDELGLSLPHQKPAGDNQRDPGDLGSKRYAHFHSLHYLQPLLPSDGEEDSLLIGFIMVLGQTVEHWILSIKTPL